MYDALKNKNLFNFDESIARDIFTDREFPWEVLPHIGEFILTLGAGLPADEYEQKGENIWIARSATIAPTASINGPCIIGKNAEIRQCAFIRGNAIVGENCVVGNSTELKNVVNITTLSMTDKERMDVGTLLLENEKIPEPCRLLYQQEHFGKLSACEKEKRP